MVAKDGGNESSLALSGEAQSSEDLFPRLDSLVPPNLTTWAVIGEAGRLIFQHFKALVLPILFLTLSTVAGLVSQFWRLSHAPEWGVMLASLQPAKLEGFEQQPSWLWVLNVTGLVFSGLAEVGIHRAVVGVYLKEYYGKDGVSQSSDGFVVAAFRCTGSTVAALLVSGVTGLVLGLVLAPVSFLLLSSFDDPGSFVLSAVVTTAGMILINAFFIVALPVSALTTAWGFKALKRSFLLSLGNIKSCFGLYFMFLLLNLVNALLVLMVQQSSGLYTFKILLSTVWTWFLSLIMCPTRTVFYLKFRAWHKIPGLDRVLAA